MKKVFALLIITSSICINYSSAQNVGIGTITPKARLHVADSSVVFTAATNLPVSPRPTPVTGQGTRLMWYADKAAFRAGYISGNYWDAANIGVYSFAVGTDTRASGALGFCTGANTVASGIGSTAMGTYTTASGDWSCAMGINTTAQAYGSLSVGVLNDPIISSNKTNWVAYDPLFIVGNGTVVDGQTNALVVYKNANTDISGFTRLGEQIDNAPRIKMKKLAGILPSSANPNTFLFIATGIANPAKILSVSALVTDGIYQFLPHSNQAGYIYTVNIDNTNIAVGVQSVALSSAVMNKPVKILITYEE